ISFSPASPIAFGNTFQGAMSLPTTVTLTNDGEANLALDTFTVGADFTVAPMPPPAITVTSGGGTQDVDVVFAPGDTTLGAVSETITFATSGATTCSFDLDVTGNALSDTVTITGDPDFGDVNVGATSPSHQFVLTNSGTVPIQLSEISLEDGS